MHINLRQFIKISWFQGGGLLQFLSKKALKSSKNGTLGKNSGSLLEFWSSGGLI